MLLSHGLKFIFICNGKTASASIEKPLRAHDESADLNRGATGLWAGKHIPAAVLKGMLPGEMWNSYFKFAFVRDPFDWFISQYRFNFRNPAIRWTSVAEQPSRSLSVFREYLEDRRRHKRELLDESDVEFMHGFLRRFRGLPLAPTLYQTNYTHDADGRLLLDFVGRFEHLPRDVGVIQERLGVRFDLLHLNSSRRSGNTRDQLTPAAKRRIRELWSVDFENFGYDDA